MDTNSAGAEMKVRGQKAIVETADGGLLVMFEDGNVVGARSVRDAERKIRARAKSKNPGMTVTEIEWRDGLVPSR